MVATRGRASVIATLLLGVLATACTETSDHPQRSAASSIPAALPSPQVQTGTMADLQEALARWHRVAATVVYRTARQRPGLPSAAHQCLRQLVDDRADLPIAQAKCDPAGVARLLSDPPARWRLEVTEANRTVSATVDEEHSVVCARANGGKERCRRRSNDRLVRSFPFHELVTDVRSVLESGYRWAGARDRHAPPCPDRRGRLLRAGVE